MGDGRETFADIPPIPTIGWVLECGCEPMVEHCAQCDERRRHRARYMAVDALLAALVKAEEAGIVSNVSVAQDDPICVMEMEVHPDLHGAFVTVDSDRSDE